MTQRVFVDGVLEVRAGQLIPCGIEEHQLAIRQLPDQRRRQAIRWSEHNGEVWLARRWRHEGSRQRCLVDVSMAANAKLLDSCEQPIAPIGTPVDNQRASGVVFDDACGYRSVGTALIGPQREPRCARARSDRAEFVTALSPLCFAERLPFIEGSAHDQNVTKRRLVNLA